MKKRNRIKLTTLFLLFSLLFSLFSCAPSQPQESGTANASDATQEPTTDESASSVSEVLIDYVWYENASDLVDNVDAIFCARVTGVSFAALKESDSSPANTTLPTDNKYIYTLFDLQIGEVYLGDAAQIRHLAIPGGLKGVREEEQQSLWISHGYDSVTFRYNTEGEPVIGGEYLFAVSNSQNPEIVFCAAPLQTILPTDGSSAYKEFTVEKILEEAQRFAQ